MGLYPVEPTTLLCRPSLACHLRGKESQFHLNFVNRAELRLLLVIGLFGRYSHGHC